jgi:hypothetical protein
VDPLQLAEAVEQTTARCSGEAVVAVGSEWPGRFGIEVDCIAAVS